MKYSQTVAILATIAVAVGTAYAQDGNPPGPPDQGPPKAGPMGPGGQMRMGPMRGGGAGPMLLMNPSVSKELKLSEDQVRKIRDLMPRPQMMDQGQGGDREQTPQRPPSRKEMEQRIQAILSPEQYSRLKEIRLQVMGPMAMLSPEVSEKLGLSDEQKSQIRDAMQQERQAGPPPNPVEDHGEFRRAIQERRAKVEKAVMSILTEDQKKTWHELTGKPFKFERMGPGFGGPGGRRGGFGPPPGGPGGDQGGRGQGTPPPPPPDAGDGGPSA